MHKDIQWRFTIMRNKIRNHHYAFRLQINWQYVHELHNLINNLPHMIVKINLANVSLAEKMCFQFCLKCWSIRDCT